MMNKVLLLILSLFIGSAEASDWKKFSGFDKGNRNYYDAESIEFNADTLNLTTWQKTELSPVNHKMNASSIIRYVEFGCNGRTLTQTDFTVYGIDGKISETFKNPDTYKILPDSTDELLKIVSCNDAATNYLSSINPKFDKMIYGLSFMKFASEYGVDIENISAEKILKSGLGGKMPYPDSPHDLKWTIKLIDYLNKLKKLSKVRD